MTRLLAGCFIVLASCGTPQPKGPVVVIDTKDTTAVEPPPVEVIVQKPLLPKGAVHANYISGEQEFYAYVRKVNTAKRTTIIAFENNVAPEIIVRESFGANLSYLRFQEFDRDLLLVSSVIVDPNFNKYYLYILRKGKWKQLVNGWAIHKDNRPDTLRPISVDPSNPNKMQRYYSVFDLDKSSKLGYTWRLLSENIDIID